LYDLKNDADLGFLMNPGEGAVTALQFFVPQGAYSPTHLLAGCFDGTVSVWRAGSGWECMRTLRGHRGEVVAIAVHPSGFLALTAARDGALRLWDLVKGRATFTTKLECTVDGVAFSSTGNKYSLICGDSVVIKSPNTADDSIPVQLQHSRRVLTAVWGLDDYVIVTGCEDGSLRVWDIERSQEMYCISRAHATRIKALTILYSKDVVEDGDASKKSRSRQQSAGDAVVAGVPQLMASASSDGIIKVWSLRKAVKAAAKGTSPVAEDGGASACVCQTETRARLTVLSAVDPMEVMAERLQEQAHASRAQKNKRKKEARAKRGEEPGGGKALARNVRSQVGSPAAQRGGKNKKIGAGGQRSKVGSAPAARNGVVSFTEEKDHERERKKRKKIAIQAQRSAKRTTQRDGDKTRRNAAEKAF
jgi:protein MAK11